MGNKKAASVANIFDETIKSVSTTWGHLISATSILRDKTLYDNHKLTQKAIIEILQELKTKCLETIKK